ncbi:MAG: DnaJ domain-containing protein [Proteobacteria bacterium]|nr:DnaJ domain-containing protein [Pseudomonadota bacterium]
MQTHYEVLGVSETATPREIKEAFRLLALKYHPDQHPSPIANELFRRIKEAYETLYEPSRRAEYDRHLADEATTARRANQHPWPTPPSGGSAQEPPASEPRPERAWSDAPKGRSQRRFIVASVILGIISGLIWGPSVGILVCVLGPVLIAYFLTALPALANIAGWGIGALIIIGLVGWLADRQQQTGQHTPQGGPHGGDEPSPAPAPSPTAGAPPAVDPATLSGLLDRAWSAYRKGFYSEAATQAAQVLRLAPEDPQAWSIVGASACYLKQDKQAQSAYAMLDTQRRQLLRRVCDRMGVNLR